MRSLYIDNRWVRTIGGGKAAMQDAVRRLEQPDPPGQGLAFRATREQLLPEANFLLMADVTGMYSSVCVTSVNADDADEETKKLIVAIGDYLARHETSYLGVAVGMQSTGAHFRIYMPIEQARSIRQLLLILAPFAS